MRKIVFISLLILLIANKANAETPIGEEFISLTAAVIETDMRIENWQVTIKESYDHDTLKQIVEMLQNSHLFTIKKDENSIQYLFSDASNSGNVFESYQAIFPINSNYEAELVVVLKGDKWDNATLQTYRQKLALINNQLFTDAAKTFTCLTTDSSAIMDDDYVLNQLTKKLKIQHVNTQYDNVENSTHDKMIYGYSPLWTEQIKMMGKSINVHVAVTRDEAGDAKYTVGTPILINEY